MKRIAAAVLDNIARTGRHIMWVFPDPEGGEVFSYTIGNSLRGLPELLWLGRYDPKTVVWLLNELSERMVRRRGSFRDGEIVDLGGAQPICVVEASDEVKERFTIQVANFANGDYSVLQVVMPDKEGRFPWDDGCADPYARQKIYRRRFQ